MATKVCTPMSFVTLTGMSDQLLVPHDVATRNLLSGEHGQGIGWGSKVRWSRRVLYV